MQAEERILGGGSEEKPADKEIQDIIDSVKSKVEAKTGKKYHIFKAESYTAQVVQGVNYFVKVHVGGEDHVHVRVYQGLGTGELKVTSCQVNKKHHDAIGYF